MPQEGFHPAKVALKNWYSRIGYDPVRTEIIDDSIPELAQMLAIPCKLIVFQRGLS